MNRNTEDDIIEIVVAFQKGKVIQYWCEDADSWQNVIEPIWDFYRWVYRIRPEPKEIWVKFNESFYMQYWSSTKPKNSKEYTHFKEVT